MSRLRALHDVVRLMDPAGEFVLHVLFGVVAVLAAGLVAYALLNRSDPALRQTVLAAALVSALAIPVLRLVSAGGPDWTARGSSTEGSGPSNTWVADPTFEATGWSQEGLTMLDGSVVAARKTGSVLSLSAAGLSAARRWLALIWLAGTLVLTFRLLMSWVEVTRLVGEALPVDDDGWKADVERIAASLSVGAPALRRASGVSSPFVFGVRSPVLVISNGMLAIDAGLRRAVVLHELAHIRRRDPVWSILAALVHALYWPIPLVWVVASYLRLEGERASDLAVVRGGVPRAAYMGQLASLADIQRAPRGPVWVASRFGPSELLRRLQSLASGVTPTSPVNGARWLVWTAALIVTLSISRVEPSAATFQFFSGPVEETPAR